MIVLTLIKLFLIFFSFLPFLCFNNHFKPKCVIYHSFHRAKYFYTLISLFSVSLLMLILKPFSPFFRLPQNIVFMMFYIYAFFGEILDDRFCKYSTFTWKCWSPYLACRVLCSHCFTFEKLINFLPVISQTVFCCCFFWQQDHSCSDIGMFTSATTAMNVLVSLYNLATWFSYLRTLSLTTHKSWLKNLSRSRYRYIA